MSNKVYLVVIEWRGFEDYDCNGINIEVACDSFYMAISKCLNAVYDELKNNMEFLESKEYTITELIEHLENYNNIKLRQKIGNGTSTISIIEKEITKLI